MAVRQANQLIRAAMLCVAALAVAIPALLVAFVAPPVETAAAQVDVGCSAVNQEACFDIAFSCPNGPVGNAEVVITYNPGPVYNSGSSFLNGVDGFSFVNGYTVDALGNHTATHSVAQGAYEWTASVSLPGFDQLRESGDLWVACGSLCSTAEADQCADICKQNGNNPLFPECFLPIPFCQVDASGGVDLQLGPLTRGLVEGSEGTWTVTHKVYSEGQRVLLDTETFVIDMNLAPNPPPLTIDPLPNGTYRIVTVLSHNDHTITGAYSAQVSCTGAGKCDANSCFFSVVRAGMDCTGTLLIRGEVNVELLNISQVQSMTVTIDGVPADSASMNYSNFVGKVFINATHIPSAPPAGADYAVEITIAGTDIFNASFDLSESTAAAVNDCEEVTVNCASLTVSAEILAPSAGFGQYVVGPFGTSGPVSLILIDAAGNVVDWNPKYDEDTGTDTGISNPLLANASGPGTYTWVLGHVDGDIYNFFSEDTIEDDQDGYEAQLIEWERGTWVCAATAISFTADPACSSGTDGTIEVTVTPEGGATYTSVSAEANTLPYVTTDAYAFTGLAPGDYDVSLGGVSPPAIAPATQTVTVEVCPDISFDATATCSSGTDGTIEVTVEPIGAVTYTGVSANTLTQGFDSSHGYAFTGLAPGTYDVKLTDVDDADLTPATQTVTVEVCPSISFTVSSTCSAATDGTVTVVVTTTGAVTYDSASISAGINGNGLLPSAPGDTTLPFDPSGTYTFTGFDPDTYDVTLDNVVPADLTPATQEIIIEACPTVSFTVAATCSAATDGTIAVKVTTTGPVTFTDVSIATVNGGPLGAVPNAPGDTTLPFDPSGMYTFTGVSPGSYNVSINGVTPADSTPARQQITVEKCPVQPTISVSVAVQCDEDGTGNGSIDLIATVTGDASVDLTIDGTTYTIDSTGTTVIPDKPAGTYPITISNPNPANLDTSNIATEAVIETCPAIAITKVAATCSTNASSPDGTIDVAITRSTATSYTNVTATPTSGAPISLPAAPADTYTFTGLVPGTYTITVDNPTPSDLSVEPATITVEDCTAKPTIAVSVAVQCDEDGIGNGWIDLIATVTGGASVDLTIDGTTYTIDSTGSTVIPDKPAGTYPITISNPNPANLDTSNIAAEVVIESCPDLKISSASADCATSVDSADGRIDAKVTTLGSATYQSLTATPTSGTPVSLPYAPNGSYSFTGLAPGPYTITIDGPSPSDIITAPRTITVEVCPPAPTIVVTASSACAEDGLDDGDITISTTITGPASIDLTIDGTTYTVDASGTFTINNVAAGNYAIAASNPVPADLDLSNIATEVIVRRCDQPTITVEAITICSSDNNGVIRLVIETADGAVYTKVSLVPGPTRLTNSSGKYRFENLPPGTYEVVLTGVAPANTELDIPTKILVVDCEPSGGGTTTPTPTTTPVPPLPDPGPVTITYDVECIGPGRAAVRITSVEGDIALIEAITINGLHYPPIDDGTESPNLEVTPGGPVVVDIITNGQPSVTSISGPSTAPDCGPDIPPPVATVPVVPLPTVVVPIAPVLPIVPLAPREVAPPTPTPTPTQTPTPTPTPTTEPTPTPPPTATPVPPTPEPVETPVEPDPTPSAPEPIAGAPIAVRQSGEPQVTLPLDCGPNPEIPGVFGMKRIATTDDGTSYSIEAVTLEPGDHQLTVDCNGTETTLDFFAMRQTGGDGGAANSATRGLALGSLMLLVVTGLTGALERRSRFSAGLGEDG